MPSGKEMYMVTSGSGVCIDMIKKLDSMSGEGIVSATAGTWTWEFLKPFSILSDPKRLMAEITQWFKHTSGDTCSVPINHYTSQVFPVVEFPYLDQRLSGTESSFFYLFSISCAFCVHDCFQLLTWMIT